MKFLNNAVALLAITADPKTNIVYFSHGFSPVFKNLTKVDVPKDIEYVLFGVLYSQPVYSSEYPDIMTYDIKLYSPTAGKANSRNFHSVILAAPKGSGRTVRSLFREGRGINSSVAVYQDVTGKAEEKVIALGVAIGSGYLYKTTFEKEVFSDLYGGEKIPIPTLPLLLVLCS